MWIKEDEKHPWERSGEKLGKTSFSLPSCFIWLTMRRNVYVHIELSLLALFVCMCPRYRWPMADGTKAASGQVAGQSAVAPGAGWATCTRRSRLMRALAQLATCNLL